MGYTQLKYIATFLIVWAVLLLGVFMISRSRTFQFFGEIVSKVKTDRKIVALTFDDGPTGYTDSILAVLNRYNVRATFFLTGKEISEQPELAKRIIQQGHSIGNHSWSHQRMIFKSAHFMKEEVERTDSIIRAIGYTNPIYFRPPYCKKFIFLPYYLNKTNRTTITWSIEPDSKQVDAQTMLEDVKENIEPGAIILLHAMYPNRETSRQALPLIIEWLQANGYEFVTVDEMVKKGNVTSTKVRLGGD